MSYKFWDAVEDTVTICILFLLSALSVLGAVQIWTIVLQDIGAL